MDFKFKAWTGKHIFPTLNGSSKEFRSGWILLKNDDFKPCKAARNEHPVGMAITQGVR